MANILIGMILGAFLAACGGVYKHEVEVQGGTDNKVEVSERFCDKAAYPTTSEQRKCKDALLAAMDCRTKVK